MGAAPASEEMENAHMWMLQVHNRSQSRDPVIDILPGVEDGNLHPSPQDPLVLPLLDLGQPAVRSLQFYEPDETFEDDDAVGNPCLRGEELVGQAADALDLVDEVLLDRPLTHV